MKVIDLHCHTIAAKTGDAPTRAVTPELFAEQLSAAGVEIAAVTNHNLFNIDQYRDLVFASKGIAQVWPGAELDVTRDDEHWHMIVVCDPNKAEVFSTELARLVGSKKPDDVMLDFDSVWKTFLPIGALFISHAHKSPGISDTEMEKIIANAGADKWRLFFEPANLLSVGIMANHGLNMIIGSDVQEWGSYSQSYCEDRQCVLRLDIESFGQFCLLAQRDEAVVETLLGSKGPTIMHASPHSSVHFDLPIYQDINVIFGQKGTGKTEIIKSIYKEYQRQGTNCSTYFGGQKTSGFDKLLATSDMKRDPSMFGRSNCENEIKAITEWTDETPTAIEKYLMWYITRGNNKKKRRFRLSEAQDLPVPSSTGYEKTKEDSRIIEEFLPQYSGQGLCSYLDVDDAKELERLLHALSSNVLEKKTELYVDAESARMTNAALEAIKTLIDRKSDTLSKPGKCGLDSFVSRRIELLSLVDSVLKNLAPKTIEQPDYLGKLEDKGTLELVSQWRYLTRNKDSKATEYVDSGAKISDLKKWRNALEAIKDKVFEEGLPDAIAEFSTIVEESGITSLDKFIGTNKFVRIKGQTTSYSPSDGEKGILLLERQLNADADVYLLDEPENGMSNLYIDSVVRPILTNLARGRKTVIIATHNANLAVRTLPYQSIYREHVEGDTYRTYLGNPFSNRLKDIEGAADDLKWATYSLKTLEGGEDAFYSRKTIYEAGE